MKRNASLFGILFTLFCSTALVAQAPAIEPRIGNWKLNAAKSKVAEGTAPPQMQVRRYEARPDGFMVYTQASLDSQGNPTFGQATYKFDGKDYPNYSQTNLAEFSVTGAKPGTNSYKLLDASTVENTLKDSTGKVTSVNTGTVSRDGRTLTITAKDPTGKVTATTVYDRQ